MKAPLKPENEADRLAALNSLGILDTLPEERYDRITRLAKNLFRVPIALLSLVDTERQWFKSAQGLNASETSRDISFCGHAILDDEPFIIPNATEDDRFADNPLVLNDPSIRFYAGHPVKTLDGNNIGTLCIIDSKPKSMTEQEVGLLHDLAFLIQQEIQNIELTRQVNEKEAALIFAKEKAEIADQEKTLILANMSHELRTPLHSILSFSDLGFRKTEEEKAKKYFDNINVSANRLTTLVDNLLDMSRLESRQMPVNYKPHDIIALIKQQIENIEPIADKKHIGIIFQSVHSSIEAEYDPELLCQVIVNLLSNAIKYSPENTTVNVSVFLMEKMLRGKQQDLVRASFQDEGVGIPIMELDAIFDRFTQSSKTDTKAGGTGLGLPISKEIINLHRGQIWAESPAQPETKTGSVFHFEIPLKQPEHLNKNND
jgi:signal transduction histidine kinase